MKRATSLALMSLLALGCNFPVCASLSIFEHGNGIKAMGFGGVGYTAAEETTAVSANRAHALSLGRRYDFGVDVFTPKSAARFIGNAAGADETYKNTGREYFFIPQGGLTLPLSQRWAFGVSALNAGLGPDYPKSAYARFGGAARSSLFLAQAGVVTALAYQLTPVHAMGLSLNTSYQTLRLEGIQPFAGFSQVPDKVSDQGKDGRFGVGYTLGWHARFNPQLSVGAAYRSKTWTGRHKDYEGLLPESGRLELPAYYGVAAAYMPTPTWTLGLELQRYEHASEKAIGNPISRLFEGNQLGSKNGPGFGHDDQNVYKFGAAWQATSKLKLRAGYIRASQIVQPSETLFDILGPVTATTHVTGGITYDWTGWELSGYGFHAANQKVRGENSVPQDPLGGGEVDVSFEGYGLGFSFGRKF